MNLREENSSRHNLPQSQCGFTLLEFLIVVLILTVGVLGTAVLMTGVIRDNFFSKNLTSATAIAKSQFEEVQRAGYANVNTGQFPASAQVVSMDGFNFSRTTTITDNLPTNDVKTVTVTVNWNEANNVARSVSLQTIVAQ